VSLRSATGAGAYCLFALAALVTRADADEVSGRQIEIFAVAHDGTRSSLVKVDLDAVPQRERRGKDAQYDAEIRMRGVSLSEILLRAQIPASADLALLRFDNGLQIPLAFRDSAYMTKLAPFIARATTTDRWLSLHAGQVEDPRRPPSEEDLRPLHFHGNKIVVSDPGLAPLLPSVRSDLRPFMYADSLASIELVERASWEAQFDAGPATREGQAIFLGTCRYCHAVRGQGGALGWDFVEPYPIYSDEWVKRLKAGANELNFTPARTMLAIHVKYRASVDGNRTMPALRGMRPTEITALWAWLQAVGSRSARLLPPAPR